MSKRKNLENNPEDSTPIGLDELQLAALESLSISLHPSLKCLLPVLEWLRGTGGDVVPLHKIVPPVKNIHNASCADEVDILQTRQATDYKTITAAAKAVKVDFKEDDISYMFNLESEDSQVAGELSKHFGEGLCIAFGMLQAKLY